MPTDNNTPLWHQGKRKEGVDNTTLLESGVKMYRENPDRFGKVFGDFSTKYGWEQEWTDEFQNTVKRKVRDELDADETLKDNEYNKLLTERKNLQQERVQLDTTADPDQKNLMVEWEERNLNNEAAIAAIADEDLSEFARLEASINNFELLYNDDESRQQYNKLRKDAERILKLANPSRQIEYRSDGLYVDGKIATPTIMDELRASGNEILGTLAFGTGAAVTLTKMSRWGRAFPGYMKLGVGGAVVVGEVLGSSKLAETDRTAALDKLGLFMSKDYMNRRENEDLILSALGIPLGGASAHVLKIRW